MMMRPDKAIEYFESESLKHGIKNKAIKSGGIMLLSRTANLAIGMAGTIILARLLTPKDFGLVTMVTAFSLLLFNVGFNGFTEAIIQKKGITHQQVSTIFWIGMAISTGLAILFSVCSPLLARFYHEPRLIRICMVFSVGFVFSALATEHLALIMRNMKFHKIMVNEITAAVISVSIAIWMATKGFGYWAIVVRQVSVPIIGAACAWLQCPWRPGLPKRDPEIRPMLKFALNTFGYFTVDYFGRNLDKILLGWRWGSQQLGYYDRAYQLFVMPVNQLTAPLSGVALATLSRLHDDAERYRAYYTKSIATLAFIGFLVSAIMTVTGQDIILFLLGPQWHFAGRIFSALGPAIGITLLNGTIGWLHLSQGNPSRYFKWGIAAFGFTALAIIAGLRFGALGVALAYSSAFYILIWPGIWFAGKPMGIHIGHIWKAIWRFIFAALLGGLSTWWVVNKISYIHILMAHIHVLLRILLTAGLCTILYSGSIIILYGGMAPILDIWRTLKIMMPGQKNDN